MKVIYSNMNSWEDYCKLRLVWKKKTDVWNEVVQRVNADYKGSGNKFWGFAGRAIHVIIRNR